MSESDEDIEARSSVGEQLRAERERQGLSLDDIASRTRIPLRHLEAIEAGDWDRLPAPTYTIGFAKSYAGALGLDRGEIGEEIRAEVGNPRPQVTTEHFEPVDPARTMPRWLVLGALVAIAVLVLVLTWLNSRSLEPDPEPAEAVAEQPIDPATPAPGAGPAVAAPAAGPVVLTATEAVWIQVYDDGRTLFQGELAPNQRYQVPASSAAPKLRTGKPEALRVTVGEATAPPIGPPARTVSDVSLLGADLMGSGPQATGAAN